MWFIWNGVESRAMDVWVSELPPPTRAAERVEEAEILGRAGTLTVLEGDDVHEGYTKECRITVRSDADFGTLLDWLRGDGEAIFSNEPDRVYYGRIAGEVKFTKVSNSLKTATIPFSVHPHKGQTPPESDIAVNESTTVYNPGTVASKPIITLTFTESATARFGDVTVTLTHEPAEGETAAEETVVMDCDAELVTQDGEIWEGSMTGDFPRLEPGNNEIVLTDCTAVIKPRWRWC